MLEHRPHRQGEEEAAQEQRLDDRDRSVPQGDELEEVGDAVGPEPCQPEGAPGEAKEQAELEGLAVRLFLRLPLLKHRRRAVAQR